MSNIYFFSNYSNCARTKKFLLTLIYHFIAQHKDQIKVDKIMKHNKVESAYYVLHVYNMSNIYVFSIYNNL